MKMRELKNDYIRASELWKHSCIATLCDDYAGREFKFIIPVLIVSDYVNDEFWHIERVRGSYDDDGLPVIEVLTTRGEWVDTCSVGMNEDRIYRFIDWEEL